MSNTLDFVVNRKNLYTTKELTQLLKEKGIKIVESTMYGMIRGEKPIPEKLQEDLSEIFDIRKSFWGKELIPPSFVSFTLDDSTEYTEIEKEIIEFAMTNLIPVNYNRPVAVQPTRNKAAKRNLKRTIYKKVPLTTTLPYINGKKKKQYLSNLDLGKGYEIWGVKSGVYNQWAKLDTGSFVMFAAENKFYLYGTVVLTLHSKDLANELWPEDKDEPFEYIYILTDIKDITLEVEDFNEIVGYELTNRIQKFNVLDNEKSSKVINTIGLDSVFIQPKVNRKSFEDEIKRLAKKKGTLDSNRNVMGRLEQYYFRDHLFGESSIGTCCICKLEIPKQGLIAGHIKKRSECSLDEKMDINVCAPFCRYCDGWFEAGYISVNDLGEIVCIPADNPNNKEVSPDLLDYFDKIEGRKCTFWNDHTISYFQWHFLYHGFNH